MKKPKQNKIIKAVINAVCLFGHKWTWNDAQKTMKRCERCGVTKYHLENIYD